MREGFFHQLFICCLIFILASTDILGQTEVDSLRNALKVTSGSERIHMLNQLTFHFTESGPETAMAYALEADSLSRKADDYVGQAFANRNLGDIRFYNDDFEAAINYYNIALALDKQGENLDGVADDMYYLAIAYEYLNKYDDAISYYQQAWKFYDSIGEHNFGSTVLYNIGYLYDVIGKKIEALDYYKHSIRVSDSLLNHEDMAATLNTIGLLYYSWGDYETAVSHYQRSFSMMEKAGNKSGMAQALNNLGILYYDWGQKDQALDSYLTSLQLEKDMENEAGLSASYNNIGIIYADLKDHDKALEYYLKALFIDKKYDDKSGVATCLNNLGELYFELKQQQQAIEMLKQALAIERNLGSPENMANNYNTLGGFYHKMGEQKMALLYNDSSYQLVESGNSSEILMSNYLLYYRVYKSLDSYKLALEYHEKYHELHDSLFSQRALQQISVIQSKYEVDQHEKEIELLSSKNRLQDLELENKRMILHRQRVILYFMVSGFIVLLFIALLFYRQIVQKKKAYLLLDKKNKEILEKRDVIINAKEKAEESDRLKSSFLSNVSHELRTPLNGILGFAEILQNELTDPIYQEMSELIRFSGMRLLETLNSIIDLSIIESNQLELYITEFNLVNLISEKVLLYNVIATNKNLEIIKHCQKDQIVIHSDSKILGNILNNLIDNAVKYTNDGVITVEAGIDEERQKPKVWIKVSDTGIGIPKNRLDHIFDGFAQVSEGQGREYEGAGLGLTISKKYVEVLQGEISVSSEIGIGSQFLISLPASIEMSNIGSMKYDVINTLNNTDTGDKNKILFIEKDAESLLGLSQKLKQYCDISVVTDVDTALALAAELNFDGIFMDVEVDVDEYGNSAIDEFRLISNNSTTPIVAIVNAGTSQEDLDRLPESGYSFHVTKPYTSIEIQDIVHELITKITPSKSGL